METHSLPLVEIYRVAVEEYRFQVRLNWDRAQSMLLFNAAVLAAGAGLIKLTDQSPYTIAVFAVGVVSSVMSYIAVGLQHSYYHNARDRMRQLEA